MTNHISELIVVEWSPSQKAFHIQTISEMLESNLRAALHGQDNDYVPVAIAQTEVEAYEISRVVREKLKEALENFVEDISDNVN